MAQTTECLQSTVKNTSGGVLKFSFLPPHGRELADDAELTLDGHLVEAIRRTGGYVASLRHIAGLKAALEAGDIEIVKTPNPVFYDPTNDETKMLKIDAGVLYAADGCWLAGSSSSSIN